jgi:hypothetical protein
MLCIIEDLRSVLCYVYFDDDLPIGCGETRMDLLSKCGRLTNYKAFLLANFQDCEPLLFSLSQRLSHRSRDLPFGHVPVSGAQPVLAPKNSLLNVLVAFSLLRRLVESSVTHRDDRGVLLLPNQQNHPH